jgi:hypothetical protein
MSIRRKPKSAFANSRSCTKLCAAPDGRDRARGVPQPQLQPESCPSVGRSSPPSPASRRRRLPAAGSRRRDRR